MGRIKAKDRRDVRRVGTLADQAEIRPAAKGEAQRVEKDGFACSGLAGQDRQATFKGKRQTFDQDDVGYGQAVQHHSTSKSEATESTVRWNIPCGSDLSGSSARARSSLVQKESG